MLKEIKVKYISRTSNRNMYSCSSNEHLTTAGDFKAELKVATCLFFCRSRRGESTDNT